MAVLLIDQGVFEVMQAPFPAANTETPLHRLAW